MNFIKFSSSLKMIKNNQKFRVKTKKHKSTFYKLILSNNL